MTEKIQYFMPVLAHKLGIGEIRDIHIAEQNGRPVLRIEYETKGEYRTVSVTKPAKSRATECKPEHKEKTLPEKLAAGASKFLFDPERIKRQREMFEK